MKVLIAEDDPVSRRVLEATLANRGYDLVVCCDGAEARQALQTADPPPLAILDWMMPGLDGIDLCYKIRQAATLTPTYIILLTTRSAKQDIVTGLQAGADDYVTKPFDREELLVRVQAGVRIVELQHTLADRVRELEAALAQVKLLEGILPICSYCKKIRDDHNYWQQVESYVTAHSAARFSHSICPECYARVVKPELEMMEQARRLYRGRP